MNLKLSIRVTYFVPNGYNIPYLRLTTEGKGKRVVNVGLENSTTPVDVCISRLKVLELFVFYNMIESGS